MRQTQRSVTQRPTEALFVRIPAEQARRLDRAAFELRRPKQALVSELLARYIDPDSPASLAALAGPPAAEVTEPTARSPLGMDAAGTKAGRRRVTVETLEPDALVVGHHSFRPRADEPAPAPAAAREVLSVEQAAELLQVDAALVARLAERGQLPGRKLGREWRFARAALLAWLGQPPTAGEGADDR